MKTTTIPRILSLLFMLSIVSCKQVQKVTDIVTQPTEREIYARNFEDNDSIYNNWKAQYSLRRSDSLKIDLPYVEQGRFLKDRNEVLSYNFTVLEGQRLVLEIDEIPDTSKVFVNIFKVDDIENSQIFEGLGRSVRTVAIENGDNSTIKIIIQPELSLDSEFTLKLFTEPIYAFPVAGHNSKNVQSYWGAPRDGGKRSHEGVDIFAKRGTPVVAAINGRVGKTGNYGLGGKQVWIREGIFGNSLYYAHLDSIAVNTGKNVKIGDTLGFVGNTGNARTTAPHLHFGIYKSYRGAINPFPFIKATELLNYKDIKINPSGLVTSSLANIRIGPDTKFEKITTITQNMEVVILTKTKDWFQIELPGGKRGFIHQSLVREDTSELAS